MLVIILTLLWIATIVSFINQANGLVAYARQLNLNIFGRSYQNGLGMITDIHFLSKLFSKIAIDAHPDTGLILRLNKLNAALWTIILLGAAIQLLPLLDTPGDVDIHH
jgi:hypothetical protein